MVILQMCSRLEPASSSSILMFAIAFSVWPAASPIATLSPVSMSWPIWPRTKTMVPRATTVWQRSLSSFCSGYVSRVLNLRMRLWTVMRRELRSEVERPVAYGHPAGEEKSGRDAIEKAAEHAVTGLEAGKRHVFVGLVALVHRAGAADDRRNIEAAREQPALRAEGHLQGGLIVNQPLDEGDDVGVRRRGETG